ncbi:MAG: hypothetical protein J6Y04_09105 [Bacteroidaceae bacterium]|nr:hypothetical protein [Bacteroidaceae bacterium]
MKRILTSLVLILFLSLSVQAQDNRQPRFNPNEFKVMMERYIAQKAGLSQSESEKVFPIFHEMKAKQRDLMYKENKLKRSIGLNEPEKTYQNALIKILDMHEEAADIEETYYKKMCKVIPAKKVYAIMYADGAFHREMLQRFTRPTKDNRNKRP